MEQLAHAIHHADWLALAIASLVGCAGVIGAFALRRAIARKVSSRLRVNILALAVLLSVFGLERLAYTEASTLLVTAAIHQHVDRSALRYLGSPSSEARTRATAIQDHDSALLYPITSPYPSWIPVILAFALVFLGGIGGAWYELRRPVA